MNFEQVAPLMADPKSVVQIVPDFEAKFEQTLDLTKLPALKKLMEDDYNIERVVKKFMDTFFK